MPMQRIKSDLLTIGILTAVVCCVGISEFMFRSGVATALILLGLLAAGWLIAFLRRSTKSKPGYEVTGPKAFKSPRPATVERTQTRLSLSNGSVVLFTYVVLLCLAGVVVSGGTMATVVFVVFAIIATFGAVVSALSGQKPQSRQG
jgi:hypothetical protein